MVSSIAHGSMGASFKEIISQGKLNDAESEAAGTQTWIRFAMKCDYLSQEVGQELHQTYDYIIGKLVNMIINPDPWVLKRGSHI